MSESSHQRMLSRSYERDLREVYAPEVVDPLVYEWRRAELPDPHSDQTVPYVRLNQGNGTRPVLFVPGFTEGVAAKAAFAAELASARPEQSVPLGYDIILPDQNRKRVLVDTATGEKGATYSQAVNYLAVLEEEGIEEVDFVTHSYGSLILNDMHRIAKQKGLPHFENTRIAMLAPAGFSQESFWPILKRLVCSSIPSEQKIPKEFDAPDMLRAGVKNVLANLPRAFMEGRELSRLQVDYAQLLGTAASLAVVGYAGDRLYTDAGYEEKLEEILGTDLSISWAVPVITRDGVKSDASPLTTMNSLTRSG